MGRDPSRRRVLLPSLLLIASACSVASCNAALGGGVVALVGGAGYLAQQCYDRVRVRVRDPVSGQGTCSPDVWLSEAGGSARKLRPCYNAALTHGTWTLTARQNGYAPATAELVIPEHEGDCPHYTHSVELTLRREGEPADPPGVTRSRTASESPASAPSSPSANELDSPRARVVPPPIPAGAATPPSPPAAPTPQSPPAAPPAAPSTPPVPTGTFGPAPPAPAPPPVPPAPDTPH